MGEDFIDGRRVAFTPRKAGSVSFLPAGSEWSGWDEGDESGSYLLLRMRPEFAASTLGKGYSFEPTLGLRDAIVEGSLHRIVLELRSPDTASAIMVESQATQMLAQIVRLSGVRDEIAKGGFSPYDLRRVTELLESRLTDPPTAQELAAELGISRTHLFRAFRWLLAANEAGSSAVAVFFIIVSLTELATSNLAGWLADKFDRPRLYIAADTVRCIALCCIAISFASFDARWTIWISGAIVAACDRVALTASQATIPGFSTRFGVSTVYSVTFFLVQGGGLIGALCTGYLLYTAPSKQRCLSWPLGSDAPLRPCGLSRGSHDRPDQIDS